MPSDSRPVPDLLREAYALPDPAARRAFLDRAYAGDDPLRRQLADLLEVADELGAAFGRPPDLGALLSDLLGRPGAPESETGSPDASGEPGGPNDGNDPLLGTMVAGRYQVRATLGEGGMGVVYLAEQVQPVRRLVALKLIRAGMDSRQVLARFDSERQALALMDHPQIARVLDAGSTGPGRPFFVMELVRGVPLTAYCDEHRLDLAARLRLVAEVCLAVQHAHQKGIIHRDLKPTNILVEHRDGRGVPKVIDFGLAKATGGPPLAESSHQTAFGAAAGTPLYMAPEQATFRPADVDTRADIYALGVLLYEVLTGSTPIRRESLAETPLDEFFRAVREEEPPTPSQRITATDDLASVASGRRVEPARLGRLLRGELDWIAMKALAKERDRRYDSAAALADDIGRFLRYEPVLAGPPSALYRARKFARRNRGQVMAAALVGLALVGGIVGTTLGLLEARRRADEAHDESLAKGRALVGEAAQRRRAERRLGQIEKINAVLAAIFERLDPEDTHNEDPRPLAAALADRLDEAARLVDGDSIGDPVAVARLQLTLGQSLLGVGGLDRAIDLLRRSHATLLAQAGPADPDTPVALASLAYAHAEAGRPDQARPLYDEVLRTLRARFDFEDPAILDLLQRLEWLVDREHDDAFAPLYERALAVQRPRLGPQHPEVLATSQVLAAAYMETGRAERAVPLLEEVLATRRARLGDDHPETIDTLSNLAHAQTHLDRPERAVPLLERVVAARRARFGAGHSQTLTALHQLARVLRSADQPARAAAALDELIPLLDAHYGPDHPQTQEALLSSALVALKIRPERAVGLFEQLHAAKVARLGAGHPDALEMLVRVAAAHENVERYDRAIPIYEQVLADYRARLGQDHADTLRVMLLLADALRSDEQYARSIALFEECLARYRARPDPDRRRILTVIGLLAVALKDAGQVDRAIPLLEEDLAGKRELLGRDHPDTFITLNNLGMARLDAGQVDGAIAALEEALAGEEARLGVGHSETGTTLRNLADALTLARQHARAIPLFERARAIQAAHLGGDHPQTLMTMHDLADALREVRDFDRAIPLFEQTLALRRAKLEPDARDTFETIRGLGKALIGARRCEQAVPLLDEALALCRAKQKWDDPAALNTMGHLGHALRGAGQHARAVAIYEQAATLAEGRNGPDHADTRVARDNLALGLQAAGLWDRVVALRERGLAIAAEGRAADHPDVLVARNLLGLACRDANQPDRAIAEFEAVLAARRAVLPADDPLLLIGLGNLGLAYHDVGRWADAEPLLVELVAARRRVDGPEATATANALALLGSVVLRRGRPVEAEPLLRASLAIREARDPGDWTTANNRSLLGGCLLDQGRLDDARPLLEAGFEGLKSHRAEIPHPSRRRPLDALDRLVRLAEAAGRPDEARRWRDEEARLRGDAGPAGPPARP